MPPAKTKNRAKRSVKPAGTDFDYLKIKPPKETNGPAAQVVSDPTRPLEASEVKHRVSLFHRNGNGKKPAKPPKPKVLRALCFTKEPYGFKEDKIDATKLKAAGITPVKDDQGDIYPVIKSTDEKGVETLSRWPEGIAYPKVPSAKLGRARNWNMVTDIVNSLPSPWLKALQMGVWAIVIAVLILIFFLGFFLMGGGK